MPSELELPVVPLSQPEIAGREWDYVKECLDTGWVSSAGPFVSRFEEQLAERSGARFAVATSSGTAALHIALLAAGVRPGDEVAVSTLTFIAPVNAIRYAGAHPVFIDAEPDFWQFDVDRLALFLESGCEAAGGGLRNRATGRPVTAILPVHVLGHPCDMQRLVALAGRYDLKIVEDATESLGARAFGRPVGTFGEVACLSFNGNKLFTTGGGGAVITDHEALAAKARHLSTQAKSDPSEYIHDEVGFNYRLTNIAAAVGVAQLERWDEFLHAKRRIADAYREGLAHIPAVTTMPEASWAESSFWLYTILIDPDAGKDSRAVRAELREHGIETRPLWQPIHHSPAYATSGVFDCPVADRLYRDALSLPSSVGLAPDSQSRVIEALTEITGS